MGLYVHGSRDAVATSLSVRQCVSLRASLVCLHLWAHLLRTRAPPSFTSFVPTILALPSSPSLPCELRSAAASMLWLLLQAFPPSFTDETLRQQANDARDEWEYRVSPDSPVRYR